MDCSLPGSCVHGDSPGKNIGVGCHFLLQGIFPNQRSHPGLPHCSQIFFTVWANSSVQFSSVAQSCPILWDPWTAACQASMYITNSQGIFTLMSIESVILSNHFILYRPLLLSPSIFPRIGILFNESVLYFRWPKYWIFSFSISPSNEYSGLISFKVGWMDLFAVQRTLKSINSLAFSFLYSPTLISIHNY